jgi:hypothetical protein
MNSCPNHDGGHEPLHRARPRSAEEVSHFQAPPPPGDFIFAFDPGEDYDGPKGFISACKHCGLLYFAETET